MVVGFTSVVGDLFHAGHVAMIQECRLHCDKLIVGIMCDTYDRPVKNEPIQSVFERYIQVSNCKGVDKIVPLESEGDLELALKVFRPFISVRFVGEEYRNKNFTGRKFCESSGIKIVYTHRYHGLSSTELRSRISEEMQ